MTRPVAFGAIAIPIVTLSAVTGLPKEELGAMVGRQTPLLALIVALILVGTVDGRRGIRQVWPAALVGVGLAGKEGEIFRRVFGWSLVLLLAMCAIVYLQSTDLLGWMGVH
jgi:L-lactate permease